MQSHDARTTKIGMFGCRPRKLHAQARSRACPVLSGYGSGARSPRLLSRTPRDCHARDVTRCHAEHHEGRGAQGQ